MAVVAFVFEPPTGALTDRSEPKKTRVGGAGCRLPGQGSA